MKIFVSKYWFLYAVVFAQSLNTFCVNANAPEPTASQFTHLFKGESDGALDISDPNVQEKLQRYNAAQQERFELIRTLRQIAAQKKLKNTPSAYLEYLQRENMRLKSQFQGISVVLSAPPNEQVNFLQQRLAALRAENQHLKFELNTVRMQSGDAEVHMDLFNDKRKHLLGAQLSGQLLEPDQRLVMMQAPPPMPGLAADAEVHTNLFNSKRSEMLRQRLNGN